MEFHVWWDSGEIMLRFCRAIVTSYVGSVADIVIRHTSPFIGVLQAWDAMWQLHPCRHMRPIAQLKMIFSALVCICWLLNHLSAVNHLLTRILAAGYYFFCLILFLTILLLKNSRKAYVFHCTGLDLTSFVHILNGDLHHLLLFHLISK